MRELSPVKVDRKIIDLLLFSKELYELTGGKVNIAYGAVLRIWHDHREAGIEDPERAELPDTEQLKEASRHTDINQVMIDKENSTVYLTDPEMRLDVGAIAKGVCDGAGRQDRREKRVYKRPDQRPAAMSAPSEPGGTATLWRVGIQNPFDHNGDDISKISLTDSSLVTSGVYERYYNVDGKNYHHIIDPDTMYPAEYYESISILCPRFRHGRCTVHRHIQHAL